MEPEKKSNGAFVGLAVIIIILVVGGIYIWMSNQTPATEVPTPPQATSQSQTFSAQDSAELNALEQDVNTTDTNTGVDASTVN